MGWWKLYRQSTSYMKTATARLARGGAAEQGVAQTLSLYSLRGYDYDYQGCFSFVVGLGFCP